MAPKRKFYSRKIVTQNFFTTKISQTTVYQNYLDELGLTDYLHKDTSRVDVSQHQQQGQDYLNGYKKDVFLIWRIGELLVEDKGEINSNSPSSLLGGTG